MSDEQHEPGLGTATTRISRPDVEGGEPSLGGQQLRAAVKENLFGEKQRVTIGRFVVTKKLGEGGMGAVFQARDEDLGRDVAVKVLGGPAGAQDTLGRARLLREAQALAKLAHPNVVTVHEVGQTEGEVFVAMELVRGKTLREWLQAERTPEQIVETYVQAGRGLEAAHEIGLVHRDFKPDNVVVGDDGRVRVLDFGLARDSTDREEFTASFAKRDGESASSDALTQTGTVLGTPAYMAPEQFEGKPTDARTDQFAFCIALWEALEGKRPFAGKDFQAVSDAVVGGKRESAEDLPKRLRPLLERGLAVNPADRWPNMTSLLAELAPPAKSGAPKGVLAGTFAALLLAGGAWSVWSGVSEPSTQASAGLSSCTAGAERVSEIWNEEVKAKVGARFDAVPIPHVPQTWKVLTRDLDAWTTQWASDYDGYCSVADEPGSVAREQMACLDTQLKWMEAYVDLLRVEDPLVMAGSFNGYLLFWHELEFCGDEDAVHNRPRDPEDSKEADLAWEIRREVLRAQMLSKTIPKDEALENASRLVDRARALDLGPVLAEALTLRGTLGAEFGDERWSSDLEEAALVAQSNRSDFVAATALLAHASALAARNDDTTQGLIRAAEAAIERAGNPALLRFMWLEVRDDAEAQGVTSAHQLLEFARAEWGEDSVAHAYALQRVNRAEYEANNHDAALEYSDRAIASMDKRVGKGHPATFGFAEWRAFMLSALGRTEESVRMYEELIAAMEVAYPGGEQKLAWSYGKLAEGQARLGRREEARASARKSEAALTALLGANHIEVLRGPLVILATLRFEEGDYEALRDFTDRTALLEESPFPYVKAAHVQGAAHLLAHEGNVDKAIEMIDAYLEEQPGMGPFLATPRTGILLKADRPKAALEGLERLVELEAPSGEVDPFSINKSALAGLAMVALGRQEEARPYLEHAAPHMKRAFGLYLDPDPRFLLAQLIVDEPGEHERAIRLAREAAAHLSALGPRRAKPLAEVERWISKRE